MPTFRMPRMTQRGRSIGGYSRSGRAEGALQSKGEVLSNCHTGACRFPKLRILLQNAKGFPRCCKMRRVRAAWKAPGAGRGRLTADRASAPFPISNRVAIRWPPKGRGASKKGPRGVPRALFSFLRFREVALRASGGAGPARGRPRIRPGASSACARAGRGSACAAGCGAASPRPARRSRYRRSPVPASAAPGSSAAPPRPCRRRGRW